MLESKSITKLLEEIKYSNEMYRKGTPIISDSEYDKKIESLRELDPNNEWLLKTEPVAVSNLRKTKLPIPMKSLNKVKSLPDIISWIKSLGLSESLGITINPKFDGLSLLHDERYNRAYSRGGSDNEGQDCTKHYKKISNEPCTYISLYTYGEMVFNRNSWRTNFEGKASTETGELYRSPRNTAAGLLNRSEASDLLQYVDFFRYGIDEYSLKSYATYSEVYQLLCEHYNQPLLVWNGTVQELTEALLADLFKEWSQLYYIDGLVIYINDLRLWEQIGRQQNSGNPLYAIAYKHPDFTDSFETTVKGVTWNASKSGALKPVVNIETVDTGDCSMENPTGYNAGWIYDHEIAKGAKILVTRSGGVIPKILETLVPPTKSEEDGMWEELCQCPVCGAPTKWDKTSTELYCTNTQCQGVELAKIIFFFKTVGVENMGDELFKKLYQFGYKDIETILNITFDSLIMVDGIGEGIANIVLDNMNKINKGVELSTLMHASDCFKGIGKIKAQKVINKMTKEELNDFLEGNYVPTDITPDSPEIKELPITAQSFLLGATPFYHFTKRIGVPIIVESEEKASSNQYAQFNVCFSGIRDKELERIILNGGGRIASGVTKQTSHLVVKCTESVSSKVVKAKSLNVPILSIENFKSLII